jgi:hypothetical protein
MTIDDFIDIVHPKIKDEVKMSQERIIGSELLLTGVKDVHGEKIIPNKMYLMDVPVVIKKEHKKKLRIAWLRGGKLGVKRYLTPWLKADVLESVMSVL